MKLDSIEKQFKTIGSYHLYPLQSTKNSIEGGARTQGVTKHSIEEFPLVTVITTVYNRAAVIEKAMCSVFSQTYPNVEYIVIDANSTDDTISVIQKYTDKIDYFMSEPDKGMYEGMNKGLQLSQGDFILILNSDDWYEENAIELLVNAAKKNKLGFVSALAVETDWYGEVIRKIPKVSLGPNVMLRMPLRHETMMVSRELYEETGLYDTSYKIIGDLKKTQQLFCTKANYAQLDSYVMYFRNTGVASSLTNDLVLERKKLIAENFITLDVGEVDLLANEYKRDPTPYIELCRKQKINKALIFSIKSFLAMHGVKL
jgi:glycosyltransferase involved in cell wall biosynthesis